MTSNYQTQCVLHCSAHIKFSNSYSRLTQPEHLILVRWVGLEIKPKCNEKRIETGTACLEIISNTDANSKIFAPKCFEKQVSRFDLAKKENWGYSCTLICILIDKTRKTHDDKQLYLIAHFTKQTLNLNYLLLGLRVIKIPKTEKAITGDLVFWFAFNHRGLTQAASLVVCSNYKERYGRTYIEGCLSKSSK